MDARDTALSVLNNIEQDSAFSNLELDASIRRENLPDAEKRLAVRLVYGVLQNRSLLDQILRRYITRGFNKLKIPVKNALRLGAYQILYLDKIPSYAAVDASVRQIKKTDKRASGMANAVLRKIDQNREKILASIEELPAAERASIPEWMATLFKESYGEGADEIISLLSERAPLYLRVNSQKTSRNELIEKLREEGIEAQSVDSSPEYITIPEASLPSAGITGLKSFQDGLFFVQDIGAGRIVDFLDPKEGERVADFCAAPGGKTTHIAEKMKDSGEIVAGDLYEARLGLIRENATRLGLSSIETIKLDAEQIPEEMGMFDTILLDVPCSGIGIIRRKPDIRWRVKREDLEGIEQIQKRILTSASKRLKPGGNLVYSTCTVNRAENQDQIARFLEENKEFELLEEEMTSPLEGADCFYMARLKRNE